MPWNDQSRGSGGPGGGQGGGGGGPWGSGPRQPWGQPPRGPQGPGPGGGSGGGQGPDLEELLRRFQNRVRGGAGGRGGSGPQDPDGARQAGSGLAVVGILALAGWAASGVYVVDEGEQGVVTRFGAYVDTTGPGLQMHMPWPIEAHQTVVVTRQQRVEIGRVDDRDVPEESLMLTGDENIVDIDFTVLFRLKGEGATPYDSGAYQWVFNLQNPQSVVRGVAESAMREVIGRTPLEAILTTQRGQVEQQTEELMQRILDAYVSGVEVLEVQLLSAAPPPEVRPAFDDVVRANQDAETEINRAQRFLNEQVPLARGDAARELAQAQAYREQVVREARGDAERFRLVLDEYRRSPRVTRDRLYFETMERIYRGADMVIIDGGSGVTPILPMENLRRRTPAATAPGVSATPTPSSQAAPSAPRTGAN
jgi:membrane protease subunit HflK